jgi:ABC-2 type transport system ATP-binding protein
MVSQLAIDVENIGFRYPGNPEVSFSQLNLQVAKGVRFGLFGPNGAGKTTLISLMTGLLSADEGHIALLGQEVGKQKSGVNKLFGFVPGGMKRRVNLAIGVMHDPAILFLDEPTVGVDVQTGHAIINYLLQLNKKGTTLVYTSHQLSEAEGLCEQVALIDSGKIIAQDNLDTLLKTHNQDNLEQLFLNLTGKEYRN